MVAPQPVTRAVLPHGVPTWKFKAPVKIGDTITGWMKVTRKRAVRGNGLVVFASKSVNQKGETVQEGQWSLMIKGRPKA